MKDTTTSESTFVHFDPAPGFHLALCSSRKIKTVVMQVTFLGNLTSETVTSMALLPMVLRRGTRAHPDLQSMNRFLEGLYGTSLGSSVYKIGDWHLVQARMECVNDLFLPESASVLRQAVEFVRQSVSDPFLVDGDFPKACVEHEKANLHRHISGLLDSKSAYAEQRMLETMFAGDPFCLYEHGRIDDLKQITAQSLRQFHKDWLSHYPISVYVVGDLEIEPTKDLITREFCEFLDRPLELAVNERPASLGPVDEPKSAVETMDVQQAKLVMGYRHQVSYTDDLYETLLVMNGILGGYSHSKLFQNVREKANLCYSVRSSVERTKRFLTISSGIAPENVDEATVIIRQQVEAMQRGEISDDEIASTVATILNQNEMLEDNPSALAQTDFVWGLHGRPLDLERFRERVRGVTRDHIVEVSQQLDLDTSYLLTRG